MVTYMQIHAPIYVSMCTHAHTLTHTCTCTHTYVCIRTDTKNLPVVVYIMNMYICTIIE